MPYVADMDLPSADVGALSSVDALAGFLTKLGYPKGCRKELTASALDLKGDTAQAIRSMELLAEHFGFTSTELDYVVNYDIKYRVGGSDDNADAE